MGRRIVKLPSVPFKLGDWVISTRRARWKGIVVKCEYHELFDENKHHLGWYWELGVQQLVDRRGNLIRNKRVVCTDSKWFQPTSPIEGVKRTTYLEIYSIYKKRY